MLSYPPRVLVITAGGVGLNWKWVPVCNTHCKNQSIKLAEVVLLAYIEDRKDSNFGQTTKYSEAAGGYSVSTEANPGTVP